MDQSSPKHYRPQWQGPFEAYAKKFVAANYWRVKLVCDEPEDAVQQCALVFASCSKLCGDRIDNPAWFMGFYKRALENAFHSLARTNRTRRRTRERIAAEVEELAAQQYRRSEPPRAIGLTALAEASDELRQVLEVIGTAPSELLQLLLPDRPLKEADEATLSRSWSRLARTTTVRSDLLSELRMRMIK